jgi:hypothetical protein
VIYAVHLVVSGGARVVWMRHIRGDGASLWPAKNSKGTAANM